MSQRSDSSPAEVPAPTPGGRWRKQLAPPPETLALVQQLLGTVAGVPIATALARPFQFPSLGHLDEAYAAATDRARKVEGLSVKSTRSYTAAYRQFRAYLLESGREHSFLSGQLTEQIQVLEGWIAWLRSRGVNHTTVNTYWRALHAPMARVARANGSVAPTRFVDTPRPGASLPQFLTEEALGNVFRFVRNYQWPGGAFERARNIALIAIMALGGCRLGEVLGLQVEDVDCKAGTIRVKRGKGPRGGKPRLIYMPNALIAAMVSYLDHRADRELATDRVFASRLDDTPIAEVTIRRLCRVITGKTGIKVAPHLLRHTCATLLRQGGIADRLSMDQLGHSSLTILQRYSHVVSGERRAAIATLDVDVGGELDALRDNLDGGTREARDPSRDRDTGL